jgi:hypothetical protein
MRRAALEPDEAEIPGKSIAMEREGDEIIGPFFGFVVAVVPNCDLPGSVIAIGNFALEITK